jgi:hypothetical protein
MKAPDNNIQFYQTRLSFDRRESFRINPSRVHSNLHYSTNNNQNGDIPEII